MKLNINKQIKIHSAIFLLLLSCKPDNNHETEFITLLETTTSWNGETLPKYPDGQPKITILKAIIPAHSTLDIHKHTVINAAVLLDGELTVITNMKDTLRVKAGDTFAEVVNTWHYGINDSAKPAEFIIFYTGIEGGNNTILKKEP